MHNDVNDMHHYTHTLCVSFSHAICAKHKHLSSALFQVMLTFDSPTCFILIFFSFFIYHGTIVGVHISECELQSTVELMSVVTFWTGTAAGDLSVECFCPVI